MLGRAFERWETIDGLDRPHAYVRRMIVNEYLSWRRRRRYSTPVGDVPEAARSVDDHSANFAEREAIIATLQRLPRRQRAVVVLRFYAGLPHDEIAAQLGCRTSTVRSQISRALATLRITTSPCRVRCPRRAPGAGHRPAPQQREPARLCSASGGVGDCSHDHLPCHRSDAGRGSRGRAPAGPHRPHRLPGSS
ncbi:MAG: sigma-70 family RNA polymerase sigma factor [Nakamurella sp.]